MTRQLNHIPAFDFHIRDATPVDAEAIVRVHYAAVHETATSFYSEEIISNWSSLPNQDRFESVKRAIADGDERFLVAELKTMLIGFGSIIPVSNELRGLYVHPDFGRRGVGAQILQRLERMAVSLGIDHLTMSASLNAESFYVRHGYDLLERGRHLLASGHEMACVKMRKKLGP